MLLWSVRTSSRSLSPTLQPRLEKLNDTWRVQTSWNVLSLFFFSWDRIHIRKILFSCSYPYRYQIWYVQLLITIRAYFFWCNKFLQVPFRSFDVNREIHKNCFPCKTFKKVQLRVKFSRQLNTMKNNLLFYAPCYYCSLSTENQFKIIT